MSDKKIMWTRPMLERFKVACNAALATKKGKKAIFIFDEREFLVSYALYLIEYLESVLVE